MTSKIKKPPYLLALGAIVACSVCLIPLAVPYIVGLASVGAASAGYWGVGAVLAITTGFVFIRKTRGLFKRSPGAKPAGSCCSDNAT